MLTICAAITSFYFRRQGDRVWTYKYVEIAKLKYAILGLLPVCQFSQKLPPSYNYLWLSVLHVYTFLY